MIMHVSEKMTLENLRNQHYFDIPALAEQAGVDITIIHRMLNRQPVHHYQAELVLATLAAEFSDDSVFNTVEIVLFPEEEKEEP